MGPGPEAARPLPGSRGAARLPGRPRALEVARWPHRAARVARRQHAPRGAPRAGVVQRAPG